MDDVAFTFGLSRHALNIVAAAKGLFAGAAQICRRDGSLLDASAEPEGTLVPNIKEILSVDMAGVRWILVIEKEATFRSIAASSFWRTLTSEGMIITGKGYPDLGTRALLHCLSTPSIRNGYASPSVYGLADFDPDGITILSIYKHGSKALAHESQGHVVPQLQWLGLRSEHLLLAMERGGTPATQGLLTLTPRDRKKATKMLDDCETSDAGYEASLQRAELQTMLMLNVKAELQLLDTIPNCMTDLLAAELCQG